MHKRSAKMELPIEFRIKFQMYAYAARWVSTILLNPSLSLRKASRPQIWQHWQTPQLFADTLCKVGLGAQLTGFGPGPVENPLFFAL